MRKNIFKYYKESIFNFGQATINLFLFLPYFFSVATLIKTLFYPWRNIVIGKTFVGFSFSDLGNRLAFNIISRTIGFFMRLSIISFYLLFQSGLMIALPFIALIYFVLVPFLYLNYLFQKTEDEKKEIIKKSFISKHLIEEENRSSGEKWAEVYYQRYFGKLKWWSLHNLYSTPPLARDWAVGYTPLLDKYTTDLATGAYLHHIKNIVDRQSEINEIERVLSKNFEDNVIIVGDEGVGKHTIIDALAKKIYLGKTNVHLMYKRILKLNMEHVLSSYIDQKQREDFFENLLKEAVDAKNIILFIDNFEKYVDYSVSIEKYGKTGDLQIVAVTSPFLYQKYILPNSKIDRLFNKIDVYEVKKDQALKIMLEAALDFEKYHDVTISYEAVVETIEKSEFYLTYIPFPEKSVDLLDNSCVYAKSRGITFITPEIINKVLTEKTHVPTTLTSSIKEKLINLETLLMSAIINQDEAIKKLASSLRRSFLLIGKRKKPLATFLFLGPTGVGKTETAKSVASVFFGEKHLIRFDMSLYQQKSDISKLIGDINYSEPGFLVRSINENPYGVLLLDEIEKANPDLLNIFLTIIDEGYFTDGFGRRIDCKSLVIIATSNAASDEIYKNNKLEIMDYLIEKKLFSPEFLNRFDGVIVYHPLDEKSLLTIAKKKLEKTINDIYLLYKVKVEVADSTLKELVTKSYDPRFGARNLDRVIRDEIEDKISKLILENKVKEDKTISL